MFLDTGPLVALFDPADSSHKKCVAILQNITQPIYSTVPVLTEAFHLLTPNSRGSDKLREFIMQSGLLVWFFDFSHLERAFELMEKYSDQMMDFADASLVVAAEVNRS